MYSLTWRKHLIMIDSKRGCKMGVGTAWCRQTVVVMYKVVRTVVRMNTVQQKVKR